MHTLSVKDLRENFPAVRSELKKGESFLLIHKSRPIATLMPVNGTNLETIDEDEKKLFEAWQKAAAEDVAKHIPPITKGEYDYYMSLAPKK